MTLEATHDGSRHVRIAVTLRRAPAAGRRKIVSPGSETTDRVVKLDQYARAASPSTGAWS